MDRKRASRCTSPRTTPLTWIEYLDDQNEEEVAFLNWLVSLPQIDQEMVIGRIHALRELASKGEIEDGDLEKLKPVRLDPDLWELRWDELGSLLRQYHGEPSVLPDHLVNLHMHIKQIAPSDDALTQELQDREVSWALLRYRSGERDSWAG